MSGLRGRPAPAAATVGATLAFLVLQPFQCGDNVLGLVLGPLPVAPSCSWKDCALLDLRATAGCFLANSLCRLGLLGQVSHAGCGTQILFLLVPRASSVQGLCLLVWRTQRGAEGAWCGCAGLGGALRASTGDGWPGATPVRPVLLLPARPSPGSSQAAAPMDFREGHGEVSAFL